MKLVAKTDIGNQRMENQDSYRAGRRPDDLIWGVVCDGMGGARGGRLASTMAVDTWEKAVMEIVDDVRNPAEGMDLLQIAVDEANRVVYEKAKAVPKLHGMGTTAVGVIVHHGVAQYVHVGDSRAYLYRDGAIAQLTKDHSMVQELVEEGFLTEEEAENHPRKNLITRALGVTQDVDADFGETAVKPQDILLLCSDGLSNFVTAQEIGQTLEQVPFFDTAQVLVEKALKAGGADNITVLLMMIEAAEEKNG